jgi:poly(A) polymerase
MIPTRLEPLLTAGGAPMDLARRFADAGFRLYVVGGSVRDLLLGRTTEFDLDFATEARPDDIKRIVSPWADDMYLVGEVFGTVGAIKDGTRFEITTYRSEVYRDESRKPHVEYSNDIATDLSRRDFTVNAMALGLDPAGGPPIVEDPYGGLTDLAAGVLRTPLDPHISFGDDPLRMLRLYRFVSTLGFEPDPAAVAAVQEMTGRLEIISAERIRDEFNKLIVGDGVGTALEGLVTSGLAGHFIPEFSALAEARDPLHRHKDVLAHTIAVVEKCSADLVLRLAALFHDVGKPATREIGPDGVSFHHHEVVGAKLTRERLRVLRYPRREVADVSQLVYLHMRPHTYKMGWTDRAVRRYVRDAGPLLDRLNELVRCDVTTRNPQRARAIARRIDELEERIVELREREELDAIRPPIDGNDVMKHLGIPPGPLVGEAMRMLLEHRLDEGPYDDETAYDLLDAWAAGQEIGPD